MSIYERIRQLRIQAGMSQDDLARAMGYSDRSMITKIESGKVDISQKKILAFARALNTSPAYLMGINESSESDFDYSFSSHTPATKESRIISGGIDKMPKDRREQALKILQVAFAEYADLFKEESDNDA